MKVEVSPMPHTIRGIAEHWRPSPPPIFLDGAQSAADRELALDLWRALDRESRRWYWAAGMCARLGLTARDLSALKRRARAPRVDGDA